jgi:PLD-like domain
MASDFQVTGDNKAAPFTLKIHRGEGMALLAMNWKRGRPPVDFVGFAIEYKEPKGDRFFAVKNRLAFPGPAGTVETQQQPTTLAPIQKFRWVHFPRNADMKGEFVYRVTPVFMNEQGELSLGERQRAAIELRRETYPGELNVTFTRGFVSSQAFVERYERRGPISKLLPRTAKEGLKFKPTHPAAQEALAWMGFEARAAILDVLDQAIADKTAQVRVVAFELSQPDVLSRLEKLGKRLRVIIDDNHDHKEKGSAENQSEDRLVASAGRDNVKRQHMGQLQHNKTIVVDGDRTKLVVCGSTNFSWRGFFVQSNNALVMRGEGPVALFRAAFEAYWDNDHVKGFVQTEAARSTKITLAGLTAEVGFSPYGRENARLKTIGEDIEHNTQSSLFYSLAFLAKTTGDVRTAIEKVTNDPQTFVYGIADKKVGIVLQKPNGNLAPVFPSELSKNVPEPFQDEPTGGGGVRMHHKFVVIDFDKPTGRVYLGSYNFSPTADTKNGENLLLIRDRRIAVAYMVEALRIFDHYHFRVAQRDAKQAQEKLTLALPPRARGEKPWWDRHYTDPQKVRDRELFA